MTTGPSSDAYKSNEYIRRRKPKKKWVKKAHCCFVALLLFIQAFLLMRATSSIGAIEEFMLNGSLNYDNTTYIFAKGGAKSLCSDLCVDLCIYKPVGCNLKLCLNACNQKMVENGNTDDFEELSLYPILDELVMGMLSIYPPRHFRKIAKIYS